MTNIAANKASAGWRDYYELCKPNVVFLMLLTSIIGMLMATPGALPLDILFYGNIGIGLCAASAAVVNHMVDQKIDFDYAPHPQPAYCTGADR